MAKYSTHTGIYIGEKTVDIVEIQETPEGKKISAFAREPIETGEKKTKIGLAALPLEDENTVSAIKKCLLSSRITTEYASTALPDKDLSVRFFKMNRVAKKEQKEAIRFEARKYIPLRIEETASNFIILEEKGLSMSILFAGAKRDRVNRQVSIIQKAGLKADFIGTVPDALCALSRFNGQLEKDRAAIIVRFSQGESAGIYIIKDQISYLTRDVELGAEKSQLSSKLISEIQLSMDYFKRQFPAFEISKIIITGEACESGLCGYITSQLGIPCEPLEITRRLSSSIEIPGGACVAAGLALISLEKRKQAYINLLPEALISEKEKLSKPAVLYAAFALIILFGLHFLFSQDVNRSKTQLKQILQIMPKVDREVSQLQIDALKRYQDFLEKKAVFLGSVTNGRILLTARINQVPLITPQDIWLTSIKYDEEMSRLTDEQAYPEIRTRMMKIEGVVVSKSRSQEIDEINNLVAKIRENNSLSEGFDQINIKSTKTIRFGGKEATGFEIELTGK